MKRLFFGFPTTNIHSFSWTAVLLAALFLLSAGGINAQDTAAPQLAAFDFSPRTINTAQSNTITVTLRATDNLSGVQSGFVSLKHSQGPFQAGFNFTSSHRISGDAADGIYQFPVTITTHPSAFGTWNVINVRLTDTAGNIKNYTQSELSGLGFPTDLEVTHTPDSAAPVLQSFSFSPVSINTANGSRTVTVTARITDDVSGCNEAGGVQFKSPSGQQFAFKSFAGSRISGDARDGVYQVSVVFPQNSETGVWRVATVSITDFQTNNRLYSTADLTALGFPTDVQVHSAQVSFGGRITTSNGRGVSLAQVALTDAQGVTRTTLTNPFGYYRFANVPTGETYTFDITAKRYQFNRYVYTVTQQTSEVNFSPNKRIAVKKAR